MGSILDLANATNDLAQQSGRDSEFFRGRQSVPRIAGPAQVPALQAPWYSPQGAPQLEAPSGVSRLIGPASIGDVAAEASRALPPPGGPLTRAAGMAPALASGAAGLLAGGAAATAGATGVVASNPQYFQSSIGDDGLAANILSAAQAPKTIADVAQSRATARTQNGPLNVPVIAQDINGNLRDSSAGAGRGFINPPNTIADVAAASTAPQGAPKYDDRYRAGNLAEMQNQAYREADPIGQIIQQRTAQTPDGGQPQPVNNAGMVGQPGAAPRPPTANAGLSPDDQDLLNRVSVIGAGGNGMENTPFEQDGRQYRNIRIGTDKLGMPTIQAVSMDGRGDFGFPQGRDAASRVMAIQDRGITSGGGQSGGQPPAGADGSVGQPQNPIAFATYGGGTESSRVQYRDGTSADLRSGLMSGQPLPADVQDFNRISQQAGQQQDQPVQVIKGTKITMAVPTDGGPMREVPKGFYDAGQTQAYFDAEARGAMGRIDPIGAQTAAKVAVQQAENQGKVDVANITAGQAHVPTGYRANPDGSVSPIKGGPADIGKALPSPAVKELGTAGTSFENTQRLAGTFNDDFGGHYVLGEMSNKLGRLFGDNTGQTQWWQDMDTQQNQARHALFGSALTKSELAAWEKTSVSPGMDPGEIRKNLELRSGIEARAASKVARSYSAAGYNKDQINELLGSAAQYLDKPAPAVEKQGQGSAPKAGAATASGGQGKAPTTPTRKTIGNVTYENDGQGWYPLSGGQ